MGNAAGPIRVLLILSLLCLSLHAAPVLADDGDPLEGLTDAEKTYGNRLKAAYANAGRSVSTLENTIGVRGVRHTARSGGKPYGDPLFNHQDRV